MFTSAVIEAAKAHASEQFPKESCGFVTAEDYVPVDNISPDAENAFQVSATDTLKYESALAFIHSHPLANAYDHRVYKRGFFPYCPSHDDMVSQIASKITWGIIVTDGKNAMDPFFWGDFLLETMIYDREFRHGVEDCYTIVRKWYWQTRQHKLKDFPRGDGWWMKNEDLYVNNMHSEGFRRLSSSEPLQEGDVGLIQLGGRNVMNHNHALIYLGDGTVAHHLPGRKSTRDAMGGRLKEIVFWGRYEDSK